MGAQHNSFDIFRDPAALAFLRELNRLAFDLEVTTRAEMERQQAGLVERLHQRQEPFLSDFEADCEFQFFLSESFPAYTDDKEMVASFEIPYELLGNTDNWNDFRDQAGHPLTSERFCYSMKKLLSIAMGHSDDRELEKILYICRIWADIGTSIQRAVSTSKDTDEPFVSAKIRIEGST